MATEEAEAFAILTPINLLARMAFSDLYDRLIAGRQNVDDKERAFRIHPKLGRSHIARKNNLLPFVQ
jgi:hypothetical protein